MYNNIENLRITLDVIRREFEKNNNQPVKLTLIDLFGSQTEKTMNELKYLESNGYIKTYREELGNKYEFIKLIEE